MQLKKNPNIDAKRNSFLNFQIGLAAITALTYFGMEVKTPDPIIVVEKPEIVELVEEEEFIPITMQVQKAPPPPPPAPEVIQVVDDKVILEDKKIEPTDTNDKQEVNNAPVDYSGLEVGDVGQNDVPVDDVPFDILEDFPVYPGCEKLPKAQHRACFEQSIKKHVNRYFVYPEAAMDRNIQGKVNCMVKITKEGKTIVTVSKSKDGSKELLEVAAQKIMDKLPDIKAGRQQGRSVGTSYIVPIVYKIGER